MLMCAQWACAQQLIVKTIDGNSQTIALSTQPRITIKDGSLIISTNGTEISFPLQSVDKYSFSETGDSGIKQVDKQDTPFRLDNDRIIFNQSESSRTVMFYSVSGMLLKSFTIEPGPGGYFDISMLSPGIYMVRVNDITFKIAKK